MCTKINPHCKRKYDGIACKCKRILGRSHEQVLKHLNKELQEEVKKLRKENKELRQQIAKSSWGNDLRPIIDSYGQFTDQYE